MIDQSLAQPAPVVPDEIYNRVFRGLKLYRERAGEIEPLGRGRYEVPGCAGGKYVVDLAPLTGEETCSCPDYQRHYDTCKHIVCATIYRARVQRRRWEEAIAERAESRSAGVVSLLSTCVSRRRLLPSGPGLRPSPPCWRRGDASEGV